MDVCVFCINEALFTATDSKQLCYINYICSLWLLYCYGCPARWALAVLVVCLCVEIMFILISFLVACCKINGQHEDSHHQRACIDYDSQCVLRSDTELLRKFGCWLIAVHCELAAAFVSRWELTVVRVFHLSWRELSSSHRGDKFCGVQCRCKCMPLFIHYQRLTAAVGS